VYQISFLGSLGCPIDFRVNEKYPPGIYPRRSVPNFSQIQPFLGTDRQTHRDIVDSSSTEVENIDNRD